MTTPPESAPAGSAPTPRWKPLDPHSRRVLGVLIEKAKTTPAGYPMTVNAIVAGCNQKNNRDPVVTMDETDVENALHSLISQGVAAEIDWVGRVPKYKHQAYEWLGVNKVELAVMAELLLRGAQAVGELRGRAARMEPIADLTALMPVLQGLIDRRLVVELTPRGRGQIVTHNLHPAQELGEVRGRGAGAGDFPADTGPAREAGSPAAPSSGGGEIAALRAEIAALRERIQELERRLNPHTPEPGPS